jgi:hypothetical protein
MVDNHLIRAAKTVTGRRIVPVREVERLLRERTAAGTSAPATEAGATSKSATPRSHLRRGGRGAVVRSAKCTCILPQVPSHPAGPGSRRSPAGPFLSRHSHSPTAGHHFRSGARP